MRVAIKPSYLVLDHGSDDAEKHFGVEARAPIDPRVILGNRTYSELQ